MQEKLLFRRFSILAAVLTILVFFPAINVSAENSDPSNGKTIDLNDYEVINSTFNINAVINGEETGKKSDYYISYIPDYDFKCTAITTYHWNYGKGSTPGTISIEEEDVSGSKQSFKATGRDGSGSKNVNWDIYPDMIFKKGHTYNIYDSDVSTWSCNEQSNNMCFVELRGIPLDKDSDDPDDKSVKDTSDNNPDSKDSGKKTDNKDLITFGEFLQDDIPVIYDTKELSEISKGNMVNLFIGDLFESDGYVYGYIFDENLNPTDSIIRLAFSFNEPWLDIISDTDIIVCGEFVGTNSEIINEKKTECNIISVTEFAYIDDEGITARYNCKPIDKNDKLKEGDLISVCLDYGVPENDIDEPIAKRVSYNDEEYTVMKYISADCDYIKGTSDYEIMDDKLFILKDEDNSLLNLNCDAKDDFLHITRNSFLQGIGFLYINLKVESITKDGYYVLEKTDDDNCQTAYCELDINDDEVTFYYGHLRDTYTSSFNDKFEGGYLIPDILFTPDDEIATELRRIRIPSDLPEMDVIYDSDDGKIITNKDSNYSIMYYSDTNIPTFKYYKYFDEDMVNAYVCLPDDSLVFDDTLRLCASLSQYGNVIFCITENPDGIGKDVFSQELDRERPGFVIRFDLKNNKISGYIVEGPDMTRDIPFDEYIEESKSLLDNDIVDQAVLDLLIKTNYYMQNKKDYDVEKILSKTQNTSDNEFRWLEEINRSNGEDIEELIYSYFPDFDLVSKNDKLEGDWKCLMMPLYGDKYYDEDEYETRYYMNASIQCEEDLIHLLLSYDKYYDITTEKITDNSEWDPIELEGELDKDGFYTIDGLIQTEGFFFKSNGKLYSLAFMEWNSGENTILGFVKE
ncbi:MAG: hypothetical protein K6B28_13150 [Lachnospiraceae bacterium]|nr:hypothetical protein [Lachnospiraceae bacterium]